MICPNFSLFYFPINSITFQSCQMLNSILTHLIFWCLHRKYQKIAYKVPLLKKISIWAAALFNKEHEMDPIWILTVQYRRCQRGILNLNYLKLNKISNSVSQSHQPHFNSSMTIHVPCGNNTVQGRHRTFPLLQKDLLESNDLIFTWIFCSTHFFIPHAFI